ncbi:MAG: serine/threonine protein kinase [Labilithrix sp.]|nr:serine/threonine protein kinase [Labilithrix sp.]
MAVEVGQVISSKYKLLRLLGDGGMGSVYEAEHLRLGTHVAIKVLHPDLARRSGLVERFLQEARVSAQIRSPHVVHVTDVESTPDGIAYLVMELLQGEPLSNVERREGTLSVLMACDYTRQILEALEAAHALGVIHRDLKPDNVFVTFQGGKPVLKLIDFGIAKLKQSADQPTKNLTVAGMLMGTPEYMAPEQAYAADKVDVRADLYAVGVMMYEMLSGKTPASGDDPRVVVLKVERGEVIPLVHVAPNVPPEVAGLVHRAMAPRPEMRFASATDMRLALEAVMNGKRSNTAKIVQAGAVAAAPIQASHAPAPPQYSHSPAPPQLSHAPAPPAEIGTGTVMGAPAEGALLESAPQRPGTGTAKVAPLDTRALRSPEPAPAPAAPTPYGPSKYESSRPPSRSGGGSGLIVALAIVALLLGAGAVVAYVLGTTPAKPPPPEDPFAGMTTTTTTVTPPVTQTITPTVTTAAPLTPPPPNPNPTTTAKPPASTAPKPSGSPAPSTTTAPPPVFPPFPSALPSGFPSAFPLPSSLPPFPSAFPLPSGFPPFPPPPPPPN